MSLLLKMICDFLMGIIDWVFGLVPEINLEILSFDFVGVLADFWGYMDSFVSLDILILCVIAIVFVDNISFILKVVRFILSKFALG